MVTEGGDAPHTNEPREAHDERQEQARTHCHELHTEREVQSRVPDERRKDPEPVPQVREERRHPRSRQERLALVLLLLPRLFGGERAEKAAHSLAGRPWERRIVEDEPTHHGAEEHTEERGEEGPHGDLPPDEVEADVLILLDEVEGTEDHAHEPDPRGGVHHGLEQVQLDPELPPLQVRTEHERAEERGTEREIRAHAELEHDVGRRRSGERTHDDRQEERAAIDAVAAHPSIRARRRRSTRGHGRSLSRCGKKPHRAGQT